MHHDLLKRATAYPERAHVQKYALRLAGNPEDAATAELLAFHLSKADFAARHPRDKRPRKYAKLSERVATLERAVKHLTRQLMELQTEPR